MLYDLGGYTIIFTEGGFGLFDILLENLMQVARHLMKTISRLGSGKKPVGTTAYMGRVEHLMQSQCDVQKGIIL